MEAALQYAALGWPVLPLWEDKNPRLKARNGLGGVHEATTDRETIRRWYHLWPEAGVGIALGARSGLCVIDLDRRNVIDKLAAARFIERLPQTRIHRTGDGSHFLFRHSPGVPTRDLIDGVQFLSDGKYIVAPPSIHRETGKPYKVVADVDIAPLPAFVGEILLPRDNPPEELSSLHRTDTKLLPGVTAATRKSTSQGAIPKGARNNTLARIAGRLRARGAERGEIEKRLRGINATQCVPPLGTLEVVAIAKSISRYNPGQTGGTDVALVIEAHRRAAIAGPGRIRSIYAAALAIFEERGHLETALDCRTLAERAGCSRQTAAKHLRTLVSIGRLCLLIRAGGPMASVYRLCPNFEPQNHSPTDESENCPLVVNDWDTSRDAWRHGSGLGQTAGLLLAAIEEGAGFSSVRQAAASISASRSSVHRALKILDRLGLIQRTTSGPWRPGARRLDDVEQTLPTAGSGAAEQKRHLHERKEWTKLRDRRRKRDGRRSPLRTAPADTTDAPARMCASTRQIGPKPYQSSSTPEANCVAAGGGPQKKGKSNED